MAKKVKQTKESHIHKWEVDFEFDEYATEYCECEGHCTCTPHPHIVASCKGCDLKIYSDEIAQVLNTFYK